MFNRGVPRWRDAFCYIFCMKYDMLDRSAVVRVLDAFYGHSMCINKKYEKFRKVNESWYSDRDRFTGRFFKKYVGKYICIADVRIIGYRCANDDNFNYAGIYMVPPHSVYSSEFRENIFNRGEPITRVSKKYLFIAGFRAVNEMDGRGYIEMFCRDPLETEFSFRVDGSNLARLQFKEISQDEFESVARLFRDDREDIPFKVRRFMDFDEMKQRKIKGKKFAEETVIVMAKDADCAAKKTSNVLSVEPA